jgi:hypothetical protein
MLSSTRSSFHTATASHGARLEEHVGVDEGEVAHQDGHALAEPAGLADPAALLVPVGEDQVGGPLAPPGGRAVHDVVVEEGERLEQLERRAGVDGPLVLRRAAGPHEAPEAERRPEPLPAGQQQRGERVERVGEAVVERGPALPFRVHEVDEAALHPFGDGRERGGDGAHGTGEATRAQPGGR